MEVVGATAIDDVVSPVFQRYEDPVITVKLAVFEVGVVVGKLDDVEAKAILPKDPAPPGPPHPLFVPPLPPRLVIVPLPLKTLINFIDPPAPPPPPPMPHPPPVPLPPFWPLQVMVPAF